MNDFANLLDADCKDDEKDDDKDKGMAALVGKTLLDKRIVLIAKPVDRDLMAAVSAQLLTLDAMDSTKPITVYVNSPGGDADSGFAIYDMMRFVSAPITTVVAGLSASAGIIIHLGGDKGRRFSLPNSRFLIHQPSTQSMGQASDLEITANEIMKTRDKYNAIVGEATGKASKQIVKDAHRDFWLSTAEALEYGLVDKIISSTSEID